MLLWTEYVERPYLFPCHKMLVNEKRYWFVLNQFRVFLFFFVVLGPSVVHYPVNEEKLSSSLLALPFHFVACMNVFGSYFILCPSHENVYCFCCVSGRSHLICEYTEIGTIAEWMKQSLRFGFQRSAAVELNHSVTSHMKYDC